VPAFRYLVLVGVAGDDRGRGAAHLRGAALNLRETNG
jgi:hypothetical protein